MARPKEPDANRETIVTRVDADLKRQAQKYAKKHGVSLSGMIRAFLRIQTDPRDPRDPPPGSDED